MPHESIAQALKIDAKTLRKHYETELASGANLRRAQVLEALFAQARKGSTSAARAYLQNSPQFEALGTVAPAESEKPEAVGKKEQANRDAVTAAEGTDWGDLLPSGNVVPMRA